jgi:tRNA (guanine37-N1)-methyltransferase
MEDKGRYFDVKPQAMATVLKEATAKEKKLYSIGDKDLTLFFTLIAASKKENSNDQMRKKSICIGVPKSFGEKTIVLANKLKIADNTLEIQRDSSFIYIPLVRRLSKNELETFKQQIPEFKISFHTFSKRKHELTFVELLEDKLAPHLLASLPRAIDFVGDIAIIEIPPKLDPYRDVIGKTVLETHKNIRTVLAKAGVVSGTYRLREFSIIAGEPKTETIHKEYGCKYYVDVAKAYFSPRLAQEHMRVASQVKEGETVVDMFAGIGPFAIQIAKTHENVKIYAIDANPNAVEFLKKNVLLNRVESKVFPILGEAKQVVKEKLSRVADRVIMNLPEQAIEFVDPACVSLRSEGGMMHFYCFLNASDSLENVKLRITEAVEKCGRKIEKILFSKSVRETAPYEWQIVLDAKIR